MSASAPFSERVLHTSRVPRIAFAAALLLASIAAGALFILVVYGEGWAARVGFLRIRVQDEWRPFISGVVTLTILAMVCRRDPWWRRLAIVLLAAFGALGLVAVARDARPFMESSDLAVLELNTRQALQARLLLGPYSRFGWHHPGPLYLYLQIPWYALSGTRTAGLLAGAFAMNVMAIGTIAWAVLRHASRSVAVTAGVFVAFYFVRAGDMTVSPWNPHVTLLPTAAFIVLCAAMAAGALRLMPWVVFAGSFLVQTHLAMAPVVGVVGAIAGVSAIGLAWRRDGDPAPAAIRQTLNRSAWLLAALWLLPVAEELTRTPGNLTRLWRFFVVDHHEGQSFANAFVAWSTALSALFRSQFTTPIGLPLRPDVGGWWAPACAVSQTVMVVGAAAAAFHRGRRFDGWLAALAGLATLMALWSATRIAETIIDHEVFWLSMLGLLNAVVIVGAAAEAAWDSRGSRSPATESTGTTGATRAAGATGIAVWAIAIMVCVTTGIGQMRQVPDRAATSDDNQAVGRLYAGIREYVADAHVRRPLFRLNVSVWPIAAGALLQLAKAGVPFAVDQNAVVVFGDALAADGTEDAEIIVASPAEQPELAARPGNRVIAQNGGIFADALRIGPSR